MKKTQPAAADANQSPAGSDAPNADAHRHGWVFWLGLLVIALAAAGSVYRVYFADHRPVVTVERIAPSPADRILIVSGRTRSEREADLRAAVSATLSNVLAREGSSIQPGQILIELDDERAQLAVREAQAALDSAIVSRKKAQGDFDRARALGTTVSEVDRTRAAEALAAAKAEVKRLSAALERAKIVLSDYRIEAPFAATVLERSVEPGEFVQAGSIVMRIADLSRLYTEIEVDEDYSASIEVGQKALIRLAGRESSLDGRVELIEPEVNTVTGAIPVRVAFDRVPTAPTGLTAVVNIVTASNEAALTVPRTALLSSDPPAVFVLDEGKAVRKSIKIIDWPADRIEVLEGLETGDQVILNPAKIAGGEAVKTFITATGKGA